MGAQEEPAVRVDRENRNSEEYSGRPVEMNDEYTGNQAVLPPGFGGRAEEQVVINNNNSAAADAGPPPDYYFHQTVTPPPPTDFRISMLHNLNPSNPLRIAGGKGGGTKGINSSASSASTSRVVLPPPQHVQRPSPPPPPQHIQRPSPPLPQEGVQRTSPLPPPLARIIPPTPPVTAAAYSTPTPSQHSIISLNSRKHTNKISLLLFLLHFLASLTLITFLIYKAIHPLLQSSSNNNPTKLKLLKHLKQLLPQISSSSFLSITLAFTWQKSIQHYPKLTIHFILWSTFLLTLITGILLLCFQKPSTDVLGSAFLVFSIGNGLYSCWVTPRVEFCTKVLVKSLEPVPKFEDLNRPTYLMLGFGFFFMNLWTLGVIGSLNWYLSELVILGLVLSLAWLSEVMRNVANLSVSRVIGLYYLRGIQSSTQFCFQRVLTRNLGSACLGSLFVPAIEGLRIVARALNLIEGEDEFMFSCAHCCLKVMERVFRIGNGWAYVQVAAYGKDFVKASQDTWEMFERQGMEVIVDSDITTSVCFLSGVCSGSICVIMVAAWTVTVHESFTATVSLLAFFIGYLMTRIAMALPHACVSCYYVCYAENPQNRFFDTTIPERLESIKSGRDTFVPTPRVPRRFNIK